MKIKILTLTESERSKLIIHHRVFGRRSGSKSDRIGQTMRLLSQGNMAKFIWQIEERFDSPTFLSLLVQDIDI